MNYYNLIKTKKQPNPNYGKTHIFQVPKRFLICGSTGSGKSCTLLALIDHMQGCFVRVVLCTKDADEPLYQLLKERLKDKLIIYEGMVPPKTGKKHVQNVPSLSEINIKDDEGYEPVLVVLDDVAADDNQAVFDQFFIRGRKRNVSTCYLTQYYFAVPPKIRQQCDYILCKTGLKARDFKNILTDSACDMDYNTFMQHYRRCTSPPDITKFMAVDRNKGLLYNGFETTPMNGEAPEEETTGPVEQPTRKKRPQRRTPVSSRDLEKKAARESCKEFAKVVAGFEPGIYAFHDLYDSFLEWCQTSFKETATKRMVGEELSKVFEKDRSNGITLYAVGDI